MRILLTGAGGPSAVSVWKSLSARHELTMADIDPCAAGLYLVPPERRLIVPRGDRPEFVPALLRACREQRIDLLIPTVDAELLPLAHAAAELRGGGTQLLLSDVQVLRRCRDKHALLSHCADAVPVPESLLLNRRTAEEVDSFPRFAKPRCGAGSAGLHRISSRAELLELPMDNSYLVQEVLPGHEYSVDVYVSGAGAVIAAVPRLRMKTDSGIAVTARTVRHQDAIEAAVIAARHVGIRYAANIQFKRAADGVLKLLEINPRFPGTMPLTQAAGVDLPSLLISEALGEPLPKTMLPFTERMVVRYWAEHFCDAHEWERLCAVTHG